MFRYETISSHDGEYKLSALLDKEGYSDTVFMKGNTIIIQDEFSISEILIALVPAMESEFNARIAGVNIESAYVSEILEMFDKALELGYFANMQQLK